MTLAYQQQTGRIFLCYRLVDRASTGNRFIYFFTQANKFHFNYVHILYILFSSCQLAPFGYPDWGFPVPFPQGITRKDGARPALFPIRLLIVLFCCKFVILGTVWGAWGSVVFKALHY